jgi:hypothetical protein
LKDVYVEKVPPNKIIIHVIERFPKAVLINLQGAFLVDQENIVVKILSKTEGLELGQDEIDILAGFGNYDMKIVEERVKKDLSEEEQEEFDFAEVDDEEKEETFNIISNELRDVVNEYFLRNSKSVSSTEFANLNRVFIYENTLYEIGNDVRETFLKLPDEVSAYFRQQEAFTVEKMLWQDQFTLLVTTIEGKNFIFSDRRELWLQIDDLTYILGYIREEGSDFNTIDLTSAVVSVE